MILLSGYIGAKKGIHLSYQPHSKMHIQNHTMHFDFTLTNILDLNPIKAMDYPYIL